MKTNIQNIQDRIVEISKPLLEKRKAAILDEATNAPKNLRKIYRGEMPWPRGLGETKSQ